MNQRFHRPHRPPGSWWPIPLLPLVLAIPFSVGSTAGTPPATEPRLVVQLGHAGNIRDVAFSADGRRIATAGSDRTVRSWDRSNGREIWKIHVPTSVNAVALSPDGRSLLTGGGNWDGEGRQHVFAGSNLEIVFDGDQRTLASLGQLWDLETGRELRRLEGHRTMLTAVAFSPDGRLVATGSFDGEIRLWSTSTGLLLDSFPAHDAEVLAIAFSNRGELLATAGGDHLARIRHLRSGNWTHRLEHREAVDDLVFSQDDQSLLTRVAAAPGPEELSELTFDQGQVRWVTVTKGDGPKLPAQVCFWSLPTPASGADCLEAPEDGHIDFLADSDQIVTIDAHDTLRLADRNGTVDREHILIELDEADDFNEIELFDISPDGRQVIMAGGAESAYLYALTEPQNPLWLSGRAISTWSLAVSPGGDKIAIGDGAGIVHLWGARTGRVTSLELPENDLPGPPGIDDLVFLPDDELLVHNHHGLSRWSIAEQRRLRHQPLEAIEESHLTPDGRFFARGEVFDSKWPIYETTSEKQVGHFQIDEDSRLLAVAPGGHRLLASGEEYIELYSLGHRRPMWRRPLESSYAVAFSPDGQRLAFSQGSGQLQILVTDSGEPLHILRGSERAVTTLAFSPSGDRLVAGGNDRVVRLWRVDSGELERRLTGHTAAVTGAAWSPDESFVVTTSNDGTTALWDPTTGLEISRLVVFQDGTWAVIDPQGRFDASDLLALDGIHWWVADEPMRATPLEVFMRPYFEPRLLPRLMAGETFPAIPSIAELNRAQPALKIVYIEPSAGDTGRVDVRVEVTSKTRAVTNGTATTEESGVRDVRLLRDGQLVAWAPAEPGAVDLDRDGRAILDFQNIALPRHRQEREVTFSAYAFNVDQVKSETVHRTYPLPPSPIAEPGRVYIIAIGIDDFDDPAWNLSFAVNDARRIHDELSTRWATVDEREIVPILLTSLDENGDGKLEADENQATKERIRALFVRLAGQPVAASEAFAAADRIQPARPEDAIVLSFSTHGFTTRDGAFHLLPSDVASTGPPRTISSDDLELWLRGVDAGELVMIIDACYAAASVEAAGFKPGPMGSRGLGQLAYDKGMRILAASQSDDRALESDHLRHGFLTYALIHDGLQRGAADHAPRDGRIDLGEWLLYAETRVPELYADMWSEDRAMESRSVRRLAVPSRRQVPRLFDFARTRDDSVIARP